MRTRPGGSTPLSVPAFRRVWAGVTVSAAGDAAGWVALVALALGPAHASLPLLAACYTMPVAVGGLTAGWALDRFGRARLMTADNLARGAVFASIPLTALFVPPGAAQVYLVAAVYGLLMMVTLAGFPSLIPSLVPAAQLGQANALEGASYGLASLTGAALGGLAVATVGPIPVLAFDAVSYLVLAVILASIRGLQTSARRARPQLTGARGTGLAAVVRLAISNPVVRDTTIMFAVFNIGEGALLVLLATSLVATLLGLTVLGACSAPMTAWAQTLRMRLVTEQAHGRLFALLRTVMQATPPLGAGLAAVTFRLGGAATVWAVVAAMGLPALLFAPWLLTAPAGEYASRRPPAGDSQRAAGSPESGAPRSARESR